MKRRTDYQTLASTLLLSAACTLPLAAQSTPAAAPASSGATEDSTKDEVVVLSPFEVTTEETESYAAATTLAGNRLNTELRDIGNAVSVVTSQFLKDTGAVNNETLLQYTTSTEVGNIYGNFTGLGDGAQLNETSQFTNPNQNTRVRGLTAADNTRDYFTTDIPWDGYNVDRVDLQRGPNSILFGQGSPAGIINNGTKQASFKNSGELEFRVDQFGSVRGSIDFNRELIDDELAVRIALLRDDQKFKQKPAYSLSERGYAAIRWEPGFLKKGSARTVIRANVETGSVRSNRPRSLPPGDYLTPWFYTGTYQGRYQRSGSVAGDLATVATPIVVGAPRTYQHLNKMTTNPHIAQWDNGYRPEFLYGFTRPAINGGPAKPPTAPGSAPEITPAQGRWAGSINPGYNPWIGNFGNSLGGPMAYYADGSSTASSYWNQEIREVWGINSAGVLDGGLGFDFNRLVGINPYSQYAVNAGLEFAELGVHKNFSLTDPSIFDFYDNLIDGPNKKEWQDFDVYNVSLAQTFFNEKLGFELTRNAEYYKNGQLSFITDTRQGIFVDINTHYTDGTLDGSGTFPNNRPGGNGTPNPNLGRPFIQDNHSGGNNSFSSDRESNRATAFFTHDFEREGQSSGWLARSLGRHTLTGLWAEDERNTENRSWIRYATLDPAYRAFLRNTAKWNEGQTYIPSTVIYLGPSLLNASSASGANLSRPTVEFTHPGSVNQRIFDSHWNYSLGVNPAADWNNNFYPDPLPSNPYAMPGVHDSANQRLQYQADNPANYIGWVNQPLTITDSEAAPGNRDLLGTSARLERKLVTSKALVWQAHFWDNAIVGTYGIRDDRAQSWSTSRNTDSPGNHQYGFMNLSPDVYRLPDTGAAGYSDLSETSKSWSAVVHFNELPGLGRSMEKLPVRVSAFYNDSTNFQPEAGRVDILGQPLPLPQGTTKDFGLLFESQDGKYTFKINKYETNATSVSSAALSGNATGFIGNSQAWGANWTNAYQYDLTIGNQPSNQVITNQVKNRPTGAPNPPNWPPTPDSRTGIPDYDATNSLYNYGLDAGETLAQAQTRENSVIAAWRAWQTRVATEFPGFYQAWGIDLNAPLNPSNPRGVTATTPNGFRLTEDSFSKGYEFEFSAQPTRNWRFTLNAAKSHATRENVGGPNLAAFISAYEGALGSGPGSLGDLRIWWGGAGNDSQLILWNRNVRSEWKARVLQEGTNVPELREWRINAITNYDFTEGRLKGVSVGGALRWQDEIVNGYPVIPGATANDLVFDIANPYMGPAETNFDFWVGYQRRISDKFDWRIQVNIRNAFQGDDLIPITVQPDGTPATYRIAPPRTLTMTNTIRF